MKTNIFNPETTVTTTQTEQGTVHTESVSYNLHMNGLEFCVMVILFVLAYKGIRQLIGSKS